MLNQYWFFPPPNLDSSFLPFFQDLSNFLVRGEGNCYIIGSLGFLLDILCFILACSQFANGLVLSCQGQFLGFFGVSVYSNTFYKTRRALILKFSLPGIHLNTWGVQQSFSNSDCWTPTFLASCSFVTI